MAMSGLWNNIVEYEPVIMGILSGALSVVVYNVIDRKLTQKIKGNWRFVLVLSITIVLIAAISLVLKLIVGGREAFLSDL